MIIEINTDDLQRSLRVARLTAKCDCQEKGGDVKNHFATIICDEIDHLTEENKALKSDRDNAISKMSKSWQHNADDHPDLLSRFVDMANRQFDERDKLTKENAELREALRNMTRIVENRPAGHYLEVFERVELDDASKLLKVDSQ